MNQPPNSRSLLRRVLPWLTVALCAAILYDLFVFYSRSRQSRNAEHQRQATEAERDRQTLEALGGDKLKILEFYAAPPVIHSGQSTLICFGVNQAKTVRIEPPVEELHPALSRCFRVSPRHDTDYKLIAEDAGGHTVSQSLQIRVTR
jgi:hypothetical protein